MNTFLMIDIVIVSIIAVLMTQLILFLLSTSPEKVNLKKINDDALIPTRGSKEAAGYDLYAYIKNDDNSITIEPHQTVMVNTGISLTAPKGCFCAIFARSGMAAKQGLAPANKVGVVDSDYTGEIMVALHNHGNEPKTIFDQDRIAQIVFVPYTEVFFQEVDTLKSTERGAGGFGSTNQ